MLSSLHVKPGNLGNNLMCDPEWEKYIYFPKKHKEDLNAALPLGVCWPVCFQVLHSKLQLQDIDFILLSLLISFCFPENLWGLVQIQITPSLIVILCFKPPIANGQQFSTSIFNTHTAPVSLVRGWILQQEVHKELEFATSPLFLLVRPGVR